MIPKVYLVPEAKPRDINVPNGIISMGQFKFKIISARVKTEES